MDDVRVSITYIVPTATGKVMSQSYKTVVATSLVEAEEVCQSCERLGYKIKDVTREE